MYRPCKLKKAIHSLKQSPHAWFDKFTKVVVSIGLKCPQLDHSIFIRKNSQETIVLVLYNVPKPYWGMLFLPLAISLIVFHPPFLLVKHHSHLYLDMSPFLLTQVFGCICFVHLLESWLDKLSPRSVKCIFLDYSWI